MPLFRTKLASNQKARKKEHERIIKETKKFQITNASEQALKNLLDSITLEKIAKIKSVYDEGLVKLPKKTIHIAGEPGELLTLETPDKFIPKVNRVRANTYEKSKKDIQKEIEKVKNHQADRLLDYLHIEEIALVKQKADNLCAEAPAKLIAIRDRADTAIEEVEAKYSPLPYANDIGILDLRYTEISAIALQEMQAFYFDVERPLSKIRGEQMDVSDKRIIREVKDDLVGIKRDLVNENRQISQQNRQRVQQMQENANPSSNPNSRIEALKSLKDLLDAGVLTRAEFDSEKSKILDSD